MNCDRCGKNLALVGRVHRCMANTPTPMANDLANRNAPLDPKPSDHQAKGDAASDGDAAKAVAATYRYRDADKRRAYQRDYMRKRRAPKQEPA